jgi:hypothetical protein
VRHIDDIPVADALSIYLDAQLDKLRHRFAIDSETEDTVPAIRKFKKRVERLNEWWGAKMLGDINGEACRSYTKMRGKKGGARRDLEDLRAAIGHHAAEGYHREIVKISLPQKGEPRDKWLTRSDAAKLIWTCWRYREMQKMSRGQMKGLKVPTGKRPLRHLARFILLGIYSGSRAGAIAAASPIPAVGRSSWTWSADATIAGNRVVRRRISVNRRSRSLCACWLTCGAGTGSIPRRSTSLSSTASQ